MRTLNQREIMNVSGGLEGEVKSTVGCTTTKTTSPDGTVTESTTCAASFEIKVD
jgi:hypothetical protein